MKGNMYDVTGICMTWYALSMTWHAYVRYGMHDYDMAVIMCDMDGRCALRVALDAELDQPGAHSGALLLDLPRHFARGDASFSAFSGIER